MPIMLGDVVVIAVLGIVVALAIRSLRKSHAGSRKCDGNCVNCRGCH